MYETGKTVGFYAAYFGPNHHTQPNTVEVWDLVQTRYNRDGEWFVQDGDEQASAPCPSFEDAADTIRRLGYTLKPGAKWDQPHPNEILCVDVEKADA